MQLHPVSLLVALLMALRGLRSSSLSHSGALTAFLLGYLTLANSLRVFGVCLLGFYLAGSKATRLGILSRSSPLLITRPFSGPVPRGTNGGVSGWGTLVSLFGGVLVGVLAVTCLIIQGQGETCGAAGLGEVVGVAAVAGLGGSLLDSFLGALLQPSYYSSTRSLIVHSPSPSPKQPGEKIIRVKGSGWDVLSNNGVNAVMGVTAAGVVGWWAML
ncbi:hypothetical protein JCM1841_003480 [Sporobolomyces salmonicolor]